MKKNLKVFILAFMILNFINAQNSDFISWEDTAYDQSGATKNNQEINVMVALHFGSPTAISSYVENHKPTTNQNGLFQIEVGNGSPVAGLYDNLPWGSQSSFIELIINGESLSTKPITKPRNYSRLENPRFKAVKDKVTSNSKVTQMNKNDMPIFQINVGSKTLKSGKGIRFTGKEPVYTISTSDISLTAGKGLEIIGNYPNYTIELKKHYVGERYLDGIVFYVDESGQHGLIAGEYSQYPATWTTFNWERQDIVKDNNPFTSSEKAKITSRDFIQINNFSGKVGAGKYNTMNMIVNDNLSLNALIDVGDPESISYKARYEFPTWFIPSLEELRLLYKVKHILSSLLDLSNEKHFLWSSTEGSDYIWKGNGDGPNGQNLNDGDYFEGYVGIPVKLGLTSVDSVNGGLCIDFYTGEVLNIAKTYSNPYIFIRKF